MPKSAKKVKDFEIQTPISLTIRFGPAIFIWNFLILYK